GHQPTDRKDARADRAGKAARGRRRGDRITKLLAAPAHGSFWHFASDERCAQDVRFLGKCGLAADAKSTRLTRLGRGTEWGSAPQHLYFRPIQVCPKDRLTLPPAGWRCGKPTRLARPLAGL